MPIAHFSNASAARPWARWLLCLSSLCGAWAWGQPLPALPTAAAPLFGPARADAGVVVVLAGGGAKGFAHLAVLRRLERDGVRISRVVGTSMGAVIGGLYASGLGVDEIERVMGRLDPAKVAFDQIDRLELPLRAREYQRDYPMDLEFGLKDGQLGFARGVSDGQRFLSLLQQLTSHVPPNVNFDELKIPFRAVATRYRDGEPMVFRDGPLHLAIRASMAAPGVFAPVEIDGETYVDGGLVANLPIEIALQEGAGVVVASHLEQADDPADAAMGNALVVANQMLNILIRQNEKRNLALLRPHDVLVQPQLKDIGFSDFRRASEIVAMGHQAVQAQAEQFKALASAHGSAAPSAGLRQRFDERELHIHDVQVTGSAHTTQAFVARGFEEMRGRQFSAQTAARIVDRLYTSGHFERVSYSLSQIHNGRYALQVDVQEKPYGPHYFKLSQGFSAERDGVNQFAVGLGYRRPWLTPAGLEWSADVQAGTQTQLATRLHQPLGEGFAVQAHAGYQSNLWPLYPDADLPVTSRGRLAYAQVSNHTAGLDVSHDFGRGSVVRLGWLSRQIRYRLDTLGLLRVPLKGGEMFDLTLDNQSVRYGGWRGQWLVDKLDSVSFPERGHYLNVVAEHGVRPSDWRSYAIGARWAHAVRAHVFNVGLNLASVSVSDPCADCAAPAYLYLGGFQSMGAFRVGELVGDRLLHANLTYMYRFSDGGLFRQKMFLGTSLEAGDAWFARHGAVHRYSATVFMAMDSKIGDLYVGVAKGTGGARSAFVQLGRRLGW